MLQEAEPKNWYAQASLDEELSIDDLVHKIEKFSSFSEADIRGIIIATENVIKEEIANGKVIRMDVLGSFYPLIVQRRCAGRRGLYISQYQKCKSDVPPRQAYFSRTFFSKF